MTQNIIENVLLCEIIVYYLLVARLTQQQLLLVHLGNRMPILSKEMEYNYHLLDRRALLGNGRQHQDAAPSLSSAVIVIFLKWIIEIDLHFNHVLPSLAFHNFASNLKCDQVICVPNSHVMKPTEIWRNIPNRWSILNKHNYCVNVLFYIKNCQFTSVGASVACEIFNCWGRLQFPSRATRINFGSSFINQNNGELINWSDF